MIGEQGHSIATVVKDFSFDEHHTVKRVLVFIKNNLPEFESLFRASHSPFRLEDDISKELLRFFADRVRSENLMFQFNEKKGVDFTVYIQSFKMGALPIFMIEAKRLSKVHYDYVSGRTGGMERIKREQDQFGSELNFGAMLGYIQDKDFDYWEDRINSWVDIQIEKKTDIVWTKDDKLVADTEYADFSSRHTRVSKEQITLFHYWISMN